MTTPPPEKLAEQAIDMQRWLRFQLLLRFTSGWFANSSLSAVAALTLYVGGYFFVVHKQPKNFLIHWPFRSPSPMVEYYRVDSLRVIYEPAVWLDKKLFPRRWVIPCTPDEVIAAAYKNIDVNRVFEMSKQSNQSAGLER